MKIHKYIDPNVMPVPMGSSYKATVTLPLNSWAKYEPNMGGWVPAVAGEGTKVCAEIPISAMAMVQA
jgi:cytochrome c oxidase assembly factor CtaG